MNEEIIVANLADQVTGISAYPPNVTAGAGVTFIFKINSPIDVLVTGPDGRRIGFDQESGQPINEYGTDGFDSGAGEPHVLAIDNAVAGRYSVSAVGTGEGSFVIDVATANWISLTGDYSRINGQASSGIEISGEISLIGDGTLIPAFPIFSDGFESGDTSVWSQ